MAFGTLKRALTTTADSIPSSPISVPVLPSGQAVVVGDLIFIAIGETTSPGVTNVTDNLGNTYSALTVDTSGSAISSQRWYSRVTIAGTLSALSISILTSAHRLVAAGGVFEGPFSTAPLIDDDATLSDITSIFTTPTSTAPAGSLLIGSGVANYSNIWTVLSPSTLLLNVNRSSFIKVAVAYEVFDGSGAFIEFAAGSNPTAAILTIAAFAVPGDTLTPDRGNLVLSGTAPTISILSPAQKQPAQANLALSTSAPTILTSFAGAPAQGNLVLSGSSPSAVITSADQKTPLAGNLLLSTFAPIVIEPLHSVPAAANLVISSSAPTLATAQVPIELHLTGSATVSLTGQYILYAATREFITEPSDNLPNQAFHGTLTKAIRFDRSILTGTGIGQVTLGWGELELINADGSLDFLIDQFAVDGRRIVIKVGPSGPPWSYDNFLTVVDCTALDWHIDEDIVRIELRDNTFRLEAPAQSRIYDGTGDMEGTEDLKGKRVPRAFGELSNITPTSVIPAELLYQFNDGPSQAVMSIYDNGVALTPATTTDYGTVAALRAAGTGAFGSGAAIEAGEFATCLAEGIFRLGGTPFGRVTCDVRGHKFAGVYVNTHADIIENLLSEIEQVTIDQASFDDVASDQPAVIGYYLDESSEATYADVIADLADSMGGWAGFRGRLGAFQVGIFSDPEPETPTASYDRIDLVEEIRREKLPSGLTPPPYRYRVVWGRNWTVQDDLFGAVDAARVAYLKEPFRLANSSTTDQEAILTDHPLAQDPAPIESYFRDEADAQVEADRRLDLYGVSPRSLYRFVLKQRTFVHDIGDVINLTYPRWDLTDGRNLRIVSITEDTDDNTTEVVGFG